MLRKNWTLWSVLLVVLVLGLTACGGDTAENGNEASAATPEVSAPTSDAGENASPNLNGPSLTVGASGDAADGASLPGCSDPNDEECPAALQLTLDGDVSAEGVSLNYPARYFDARTGADTPDNVLIVIEPSERNKYDERAVFEVYWADSIEAATATLNAPESTEWQTETLHGVIAVSKDLAQDPPLTTTVGALSTAEGRVLVLKLTTTGKYGWDLWSRVYEDMLKTLRVE